MATDLDLRLCVECGVPTVTRRQWDRLSAEERAGKVRRGSALYCENHSTAARRALRKQGRGARGEPKGYTRQQEAYDLHKDYKMSYGEIATMMKVTVPTVEKYIAMARAEKEAA